jgi:hypothetical protein
VQLDKITRKEERVAGRNIGMPLFTRPSRLRGLPLWRLDTESFDCLRTIALVWVTACSCANADVPYRVRPTTETVEELREASRGQPDTAAGYLDDVHDFLYRRVQYLIQDVDNWFVNRDVAPLPVAVSPLRIDFDGDLLHRQDGFGLNSAQTFDATLALPNLERRLHVFVTNESLQEIPGDPASQQSPFRAGLRFIPGPDLDFEAGVRAKRVPSAFAALKWARAWSDGDVHAYPFVKLYAESGKGLGASSGVAVDRWSDRWVMRSSTYADWVRNTASTEWNQSIILGYARAVIQERNYDRLADGRDLACGVVGKLSISGYRTSRTALYEASVLFKRPLHGGWLFGYAGPLLRWERASDWHPDVGVRIGFDALFWGTAAQLTPQASYCR